MHMHALAYTPGIAAWVYLATCIACLGPWCAVDLASSKATETMEDSSVAAPAEDCTCAAIRAWRKSEQVMARMMQGSLVFLPAECKKIQREHLGENVDLLGPLIAELGSLLKIYIGSCCM